MVVDIKKRRHKIVIFGAGKIGYVVKKVLDGENLEYQIVDNYKEGWNQQWGVAIRNAYDYFEENKNEQMDIIIAMGQFKEALKQINEQKLCAEAIWIRKEILTEY